MTSSLELAHACGQDGQDGQVSRVADPEPDRLHGMLQLVGYYVLMTDLAGTIIARHVRGAGEGGARQRRLWTDAVWSADIEGINGVGTCFAEQHPVTIDREQHSRDRHTRLTCTDAPCSTRSGR